MIKKIQINSLIDCSIPLSRCMLWLVPLFFIYGCMPVFLAYWEPSSQIGTLRNYVPGVIGYKDMIEFAFNDVNMQLYSNGYYLQVKLIIPEGKSVAFIKDELELNENNITRMVKFKINDWDKKTLNSVEISPMQVMSGEDTRIPNTICFFCGSQPKIYEGGVKFTEKAMTMVNYSIKLPPIRVNGNIYTIPAVSFTKKDGVGIGPINSWVR